MSLRNQQVLPAVVAIVTKSDAAAFPWHGVPIPRRSRSRHRISPRPLLPHRQHLPVHADGKIPSHRRVHDTSARLSSLRGAGPRGNFDGGGVGDSGWGGGTDVRIAASVSSGTPV